MKFDAKGEQEFRAKYSGKMHPYDVCIQGMGTDLMRDPSARSVREIDEILENFLKTGESLEAMESYSDHILQTQGKNVLLSFGADRIGTSNIHRFETRFIHSSAKVGIGVGYCGTPNPDIAIGDYLIVEQADVRSCLADELSGKFTNLVGGEASPRVVDALYKVAKETEKTVHKGKVITVQDFDSSNNPAIITRMHRCGYSGIDMETAYNLQVSDWHFKHGYDNKEIGMILLVSDNQTKKCDTSIVNAAIQDLGKEEIGKATRIAIEAALSLLK